MRNTTTIDILIVGAGPVGLTAALEAQRLGLTARIIDRKPRRSTNDSRALVVHPRVLELLAPNDNIAHNIINENMRPEKLNVHFDPPMVVPLDMSNLGDTEFAQAWLPQYETERILEEEIERNGGAVEYGMALEALVQNNKEVKATLRHQDGEVEDFYFKYVIGCDGGRSKTRELLGIDMQRAPSRIYFVVADVAFIGASPLSEEKAIHMFPHEEGIGLMFPLPKMNSFRLVFQTPEGTTNKSNVSLDKAYFEALLLERTGMNFEVELCGWQTIFEITHGVSDKFRDGRIFLAGDASHVHSPVGGQGMNYGMQDVCNLLWKLAWAERCNKQSPRDKKSVETILQSYETERHAMGDQLISTVEFSTMLLTTRNKGIQAFRNLFMRLVIPHVYKDGFRRVGQLELKYKSDWSPIILDAPFGCSTQYICKPGERLPNLLLADGTERLHKLMSREQHTWVFINSEIPESVMNDVPNAVVVSPSRNGQTSIPSIPEKSLLKPQVLLVRPDLFVAGVDGTYRSMRERAENAFDAVSMATM